MGCLKDVMNTKIKIPVIIQSRLRDIFVGVMILNET